MLKTALKLLKKINDNGYQAYIVGGFVRDYILGIESSDIDINTNATPKQVKEIFNNSCLPNEDYGSVTVVEKGIRFEITTFRKERAYVDNRRPTEIEYIDDLYQDLLRRDFTINTLCMNKDGEIIDLLGGRDDIDKKIIRCVGKANIRFEEDALRILRAIRFATILDFSLDEEVKAAIIYCRKLLRNLSYYRKKEELDKIFVCPRAKEGIDLLLKLGLDKYLDLDKLRYVTCCNSLIGIWSVLDVTDKYVFNSNEKQLIKTINIVLKLNNLDPMTLYTYGLYANSVAAEIKGIDIKSVTESYNNLVIHTKKDLDITSKEIMDLFNKKEGKYLKDIYNDIEREVLYRRLLNEKSKIIEYILNKYKMVD